MDALAVALSFIFLLYASISDLKSRRVGNIVWILMGICGIFLLFLGGIDSYAAISAVFMSLFALLLYYSGDVLKRMGLLSHGFYGGADAKAIIALSIMVPRWPSFITDPIPIFFSLSVLLNGAVLSLFVPLALFLYNLSKGYRKLPDAFLAIETDGEYDEKKFWLYKTRGGKTLITPKIPFILFLLLGFLASLLIYPLIL